jgi:hypothetical protein
VASRTVFTTTVTRVSITEDAPVRLTPPQRTESAAPAVSWWWLVTASIVLLALVGGTLGIWWARSHETRTTSYRVLGDLAGIRIAVGDADVEIDGGATALEVRRVDEFAFGHPPADTYPPPIENGTVNIESRCPDQVIGSCRSSFHLVVPDNVPLDIETSRGTVRIAGVRQSVRISTGSGDIATTGFCGFSLAASSDSGNVRAVSECPAERLELRSRTGDVTATVPAGRYTVDAQSDTGDVRMRGIVPIDDAGFVIQALSTNGNVTVQAG